MVVSSTKRYILPFSEPKKVDTTVEVAAVCALAEYNRSRGGGILTKQPEEKIVFIAKLGYPLWLVPKDNSILIFDGLDETSFNLRYYKMPSAQAFMAQLLANMSPRDKYAGFLSENSGYFLQSPKEQQFKLSGILANIDFRVDFNSYVGEATELSPELPVLEPILDIHAISLNLSQMEKLQNYLRDDLAELHKILKEIHKTTNQHVSEVMFEETSAKEEAEAKIKAQEEFTKPQITKLNRDFKAKLKELAKDYDKEIEHLTKLKRKTLKIISKVEREIRHYEQQAKIHSQRGHEIYERRWKDKAKEAQKELSCHKKGLKSIEYNIKKTSREKGQTMHKTKIELEEKTKLMRQPLVDLEEEKNRKIAAFKKEIDRLFDLEKEVAESINRSIKNRETVAEEFSGLGIDDDKFDRTVLVYVPFYVICYEANMTRRYLCFSPSTVKKVDLSARFKSAIGFSKIKDLFTPLFSSLPAVVGKVESYPVNSILETRLYELGNKNNLLKDDGSFSCIASGLSTLRDMGWLSEREATELSGRFIP
jgi:hypothetical protein